MMNSFRKIVVFFGLIVALTFAFNANYTAIEKTENKDTTSNFSEYSSHSSAFIEPQNQANFTLNFKTNPFTITKWFENYLIAIPDYTLFITSKTFLNQNSNRFENVLLLLYFPSFLVI